MGGSERVAALQRARQRQARIEVATGRAVRAGAALERAKRSRELAIERHDEKVAASEAAAVREAVELSKVCGSIEAAAEILGLPIKAMRRLIRTDEPQPQTPARQARVQRSTRGQSADAEQGGQDEQRVGP
jgi:hypothetical protein